MAPTVSPEALDQVLRGGKQVPAPRRPWDGHDPHGKRRLTTSLRMNAYEHALLHYVAGMRQRSVQQTLMELVREAALADIRKREAR